MELEILNRARGRKRDETTRKAILRAAYDLLAADGYKALTFEGVAARSGSGKSTIYRWWPTKASLATDALVAELTPMTGFVRTGSAIQDIRIGMHLMADTMSGTNGKVIACILGGGREDPETVAMYKEKIAGPRRDIGLECLRLGIATGELRADLDIEAALDALFLPIVVRLMMGLGPADVAWIDRLTDTVLKGIAARPGDVDAVAPSSATPMPAETTDSPKSPASH